MECPLETRQDREILVAYSSRALNGDDTQRLETHLKTCSACSEFVRGQRAVFEALDAWEAPPVPVDFDRRVYARIEREGSWWQRMRFGMSIPWLYRALLPLTTVAALVVLGVVLERPSPHRAQPQPATAEAALQPDQVVSALDEMEVIDQFNHLMKPDSAPSKM
jgi:anti-sigma factor RsiW